MAGLASALLVDMGFPAALGFIIGYAAKKVVKLALTLLGSFLIGLFYLQQKGVVSINLERLESLLANLTTQGYVRVGALVEFLKSSVLPSGSFLIGLALGLKKG